MKKPKTLPNIIQPVADNDGITEHNVSEGYWVSRRTLIAGCNATIAFAALSNAAKAFAQTNDTSFTDFLERANAVAVQLVSDTSVRGQDEYLRSLAATAAAISDAPLPEKWNDSGQSDAPGTYIGFVPGGSKFAILHWRMDPNTRIIPHAHTYGNVVTVGIEGVARVRNYEVIGERNYSTETWFEAQKTVDQVLRPGDVNLVSLERNYIHGFQTGDMPARGLDITTRLKLKPQHKVPYLEFEDPEKAMGVGATAKARWKHA